MDTTALAETPRDCAWTSCSANLCFNIRSCHQYRHRQLIKVRCESKDADCNGTLSNMAKYKSDDGSFFSFEAGLESVVCENIKFKLISEKGEDEGTGKWKTSGLGDGMYLNFIDVDDSSVTVKGFNEWACDECREGAACDKGFSGTEEGYWFLPPMAATATEFLKLYGRMEWRGSFEEAPFGSRE